MNETVCPHIGFTNDPKTTTFSPDLRNVCHHAHSPVHISLEHQASFCFSENFTKCPGYSEGWGKSVPKDVVASDLHSNTSKRTLTYIIVGIVFSVLITAGVILGISGGLPGLDTPLLATTTPASYTVVQKVTQESTHTPEPSETALPLRTATPDNRSTNTPTEQDTQTPGPALLTPIVNEYGEFVVHQVEEGESLQFIADIYKTKPDVLKIINALDSGSIWPEQILVVWVGQETLEGLPVLNAKFQEEGSTIAELAAECGCLVEDLINWNQLEGVEWVDGSRWVIIPVSESE
jgi:LysM repeat protein